MGLFGGDDPKMKVTDYYVSVHYGLCHGPVDEFTALWYGEKLVWEGSISGPGTLGVAKGDLFGGNKVEGGLVGAFTFMPGGDDQVVPASLAGALARNGAAPDDNPQNLPGYRGICSVYMDGGVGFENTNDEDTGDDYGGSEGGMFGNFASLLRANRVNANIGSNTAYIKALWFRLRRAPKGVPFGTTIGTPRADGQNMELANPAGIIYECMTNADWGMGLSSTQIDDVSFEAAADTLFAEGFGIGILWHRQESVEDFISVILDHVDASLCFDPFLGQFRLKLIRGDYNVDDLPVIGPGDAVLESFQRTGWGETVNEITVKWTNPFNEKSETVTVHDTANVSVQGGAVVGETLEYPGLRNSELALRVATRELLTRASSMATADMTVNRRAYKLLPGDVVALRWPLYGYDRLPMRVTQVDYGNPGDQKIKLSLIEDIFGMPESSFVESPGTGWVNPAVDPEPLLESRVFSIPFYSAVQKAGNVTTVKETDPGDDFAAMVGTHDSRGVYNYDLVESTTTADGQSAWKNWTKVNLASRAVLGADLAPEVQSVVPIDERMQEGGFTPGAVIWIGPDDDTAELAYVEDVNYGSWQLTLRRGVLDTVPAAWVSGTAIWSLSPGSLGLLNDERSVGSTVTLRALTKTSKGRLPVGDAPDVSATTSGRLHRPYRPANVRVAGVLWPDPEATTTFPVTLTWAGRNRLTETAVLNAWTDGSVTPEAGTSYEVELLAEDGNGAVSSFHVEDVGTATSYEIDPVVTPPPSGTVYLLAEVRAKRDGLTSWQNVRHRLPLLNAPGSVSATHVDVNAPGDVTADVIDINAPTDVTATET